MEFEEEVSGKVNDYSTWKVVEVKPLVSQPYSSLYLIYLGLFPILFPPQITTSLKDNLLPALPHRSPHQEALSVFLLLPECPVMHDAKNWMALVVPFAEAVHKMTSQSLQVLSKFDYFYVTWSVFSLESHGLM